MQANKRGSSAISGRGGVAQSAGDEFSSRVLGAKGQDRQTVHQPHRVNPDGSEPIEVKLFVKRCTRHGKKLGITLDDVCQGTCCLLERAPVLWSGVGDELRVIMVRRGGRTRPPRSLPCFGSAALRSGAGTAMEEAE
jgi:hypothetical protein